MKEICVNCKNNCNCEIREEIHKDNFVVGDCENFVEKKQNSLVENIAILIEECIKRKNYTALEIANKIDSIYQQEFLKLEKENIELKYTNSGRHFCTSKENCWAKSENNECRTIENCQYKISQKNYELNKLQGE